ncbi:MAG: L-seryl-tRNA(Sec) selenium transferase [Spirochaetes bacterium]|nr:L-seryl-tRNA(Sec) selenium transferase [Spirochaetota bacterium]
MENLENILKQIPQVEKLLQIEEISRFIPDLGRALVVKVIREEIRKFRDSFDKENDLEIEDLSVSIISGCIRKRNEKLRRVINGTGVVIHTNLGRAPIAKEIIDKLSGELSRYTNLEFDLTAGKRGKRGGFVEELISNLTSAEDAIIVNNNAASVFLILNEFAKGKDVIISRSELVQIGGGFRIPDIMHQTGANLIEVGTTNITELADYKNAITENTAMILSVHQSNFKMEGFTKSTSLKDLSSLKNGSIIYVRDLGSGNLLVDARFPKTFEPTISSELSQGIDLVCFSGDKMLGSGQAGIIVGRRDLVQRLRKNPLMRMLRVDKITYYLLQETLVKYANREIDDISLWGIIFQNKKALGNKLNRLMRNIKSDRKKETVNRISVKSVFGGGTSPNVRIESSGIQINIPGMTAKEIHRKLLDENIPILGYILDDILTLDIRTIYDDEIPIVAAAIESLLTGNSE